MEKVTVGLHPLINKINLPTVIKTAILPGETIERIFVATQVGVVYYLGDEVVKTFIDISDDIISLGSNGGYDERGLLGLAFHPDFNSNGLFYLHYSVAGTKGPGALTKAFKPNPCDPKTLNLKWTNRENQYDHIDTVEEWKWLPNGDTQKERTFLNLRRPFMNHNGVNSLNFSPENGNLVITTGDGGSGYDPFNLSQDDMEIAGKIIEINVSINTSLDEPPTVSRFDEIPESIQKALTVIAKGVRNIPGISYQKHENQYIKYVGNVGQDLVESVFSFVSYRPIPVTEIVNESKSDSSLNLEGFVNLGWRGLEGSLPTSILRSCDNNPIQEKIIAYYNEAIATFILQIPPLTCYYHIDNRQNKFAGTALTGVQAYSGNAISELTGSVVFTDFVVNQGSNNHNHSGKGALAYTRVHPGCKQNEYSIIETAYDFGTSSAFYTCLGTNQDHTKLYLGVYGSMNVTDLYQGTIFEIIP